jgi:hypothetical protein
LSIPGSALDVGFAGRRGPLFRLALRTTLLTVLTLGIYRFWMKTRLRRFYWSSLRPGGHPLEYVGEPLEKLLGFLIAVVILAFYIGVVNLILMFFSFAVLHGNVTAYVLSFVGIAPIWFYASYRAWRYVLARTRWRGLRFGLEPGAWGYAWRALLHWAITILTAGALWPRMTFALEKYRTDRTFIGSARLDQGGDWRMLYPVFLPVLACLVLGGISLGFLLIAEDLRFAWPLGGVALVLPAAAIHYRVQSRARLASTKTAGGIALHAAPRTGRILAITALGYTIIFLVAGTLTLALGVVVVLGLGMSAFGAGMELPVWMTTGLGILLYFLIFVLWAVLRHVFVTLPTWRHYAETLTISGAPALASVQQRDRDPHREAEGFAEALDLGAAI